MRERHYLGFHSLVGESMRHVAEAEGEWVALMGWGASAFKCGARDRWIGWGKALQWARLKYIANNMRFLILPGERRKNLASRVLGMNVRRLRSDWEGVHGHPVLMAETFVDPQRFKGTCYRAAGWSELGGTRGYGRNGKRYYEHGIEKKIFIKPLITKAREALADPEFREVAGAKEVVKVDMCNLEGKGGLLEALCKTPEPRRAQGMRHSMRSVLAVGICAVLSGARHYKAIGEWANRSPQNRLKRLGCRYDRRLKKHIAPSEPTIRRVLQRVDAEAVDKIVGQWLMEQAGGGANKAIALDGKTLKGSRSGNRPAVYLLGAFLHQQEVVIAQRGVDDKTNEIPNVRPLLEALDIEGAVVTADAMHTQKDTAKFIVEEKKADYLFTVKDNQQTLKEDIEALKLEAFPPSARNGGERPRS